LNHLKTLLLSTFIFTCLTNTFAQKYDSNILGRWDISMEVEEEILPSWLEVTKSGYETLVGRFVYAFGSARPISEIKKIGDAYHFEIPRQWEPLGHNMEITFQVLGDELKGTMIYTDDKEYTWTAVRQPKLAYNPEPEWAAAKYLFIGKTMDDWIITEDSQWTIANEILTSPKSGVNLVTKEKFTDFKLHIEFRYPKDGNSGVYLRGRHEVQVSDDYGKAAGPTQFGAIYGFIVPNEMAAKPAGQWQTYDITLIGNRVTVVANGKAIIVDQVIPGITGGALDANEGMPGPLMLQGDHGPVEYRNIVLTPVK
jgi:hypothetical protein